MKLFWSGFFAACALAAFIGILKEIWDHNITGVMFMSIWLFALACASAANYAGAK